ncbi:aldehyde dehydrogenase family protein [Streptomyces bauhiniae]
MREAQHLYIKGEWTEPVDGTGQQLTDPATGRPSGRTVLGGAADVDRAVRAAREAFPAFGAGSAAERIELLEAIGAEYARQAEDVAQAVTAELGSPSSLSRTPHVPAAQGPWAEDTFMGPVVSASQWDTVQGYIRKGIDQGARLVTGGPGKPDLPESLRDGHFVTA